MTDAEYGIGPVESVLGPEFVAGFKAGADLWATRCLAAEEALRTAQTVIHVLDAALTMAVEGR